MKTAARVAMFTLSGIAAASFVVLGLARVGCEDACSTADWTTRPDAPFWHALLVLPLVDVLAPFVVLAFTRTTVAYGLFAVALWVSTTLGVWLYADGRGGVEYNVIPALVAALYVAAVRLAAPD